jgi:hypothetical protein
MNKDLFYSLLRRRTIQFFSSKILQKLLVIFNNKNSDKYSLILKMLSACSLEELSLIYFSENELSNNDIYNYFYLQEDY